MLKQPILSIRNLAVRLRSEREGAIIPIFGIMLVIIIVMAGAAVDVSRVVNAREKLSYALDAAALAAATQLSTQALTDAEIQKVITDSFKGNMSDADFLDEAIDNLSFVVDSENGRVTVTSAATMDNMFIDFGGYGKQAFGPETFTFGTNSQVTFSRFDIEMAMVVDVTGSMGWALSDLKDAAESVVNILIPDGSTESKVKISLVPYSVGVNMDSYASAATNGYSTRCATERTGGEQYTDASYTVEPLGNGSGTYRAAECSDSVLQPLTDDRSTLMTAIGDLETDGYTAGHTGIGVGWYTLSPNWKDLWPTESAPAEYSNTEVLKFALIMTDGAFNTRYEKVTWTKTQCQNYEYKGVRYDGTCLDGTNDYWVEKRSSGYSGKSSQRALSLCSAMKNAGVTIYTVYFGTATTSSQARVMRECADPDKYYVATSADDLIAAFSNIAKKIQQVYLSQ
ncbi:TadE/TadG family type IV pilus assembly protein [Roseibium album]|uniref:Flp pilus assembly protein TadG n=1 Tax=Roseibium album TaxID=311410 RepID=A0A0M7AEH8_9HYPH|nr:pilus assembly protein TadG-related protein [Roseibium album]MBG6157713.1 Flp pilus assembly protein TadG [Labrenzia sp. EL_162]MBG6163143.1 Flp pilus assembly protein TadG [Labrenzia sp. EL_195]MBG6195894.1 Flp pilus assembly protein TadG [Labrenzia sp. EL_159]MBG6201318.1 Flp pilus assembly protein TadG [Labrenzia sp. EL_13]MBG6209021.1 Flp pilus assembly protein TadG [Labrenzia sp. EL_126]